MSDKTEKRSGKLIEHIAGTLLKRMEMPIPSYEKRIINNMANLYKEIRVGDVVLVEGRSRISRVIQLFTKSSWSHSAFYIGDQLKDSGVGGAEKWKNDLHGADETDLRHMLIEANAENGVTAVPLSKYKDQNMRICRPFGISLEDLRTVVDDVVDNLGKHYDHENLVDLALLLLPSFLNPFKKRTIHACLGGCTEYQVICSGMIAKAFQKVGYPIVPELVLESDVESPLMNNPYGSRLIMRHYSQIVPRDFDLSPNFEIIKYNIISLDGFNYKTIWAEKPV